MESLNAKDQRSAEVNDGRATEEVLRLRRTVRDLVALSSLPSIWVDYDLDPSLQNLTDVLRATLRALTVCMRIEKPDGARFEAGACEGLSQEGPRTHNPVALLDEVPGSTELVSIPGLNGGRPMNALAHPVFANGKQIGKLVACFRGDFFPAENERLILQVAASQIMLLLQRHKAQENTSRLAAIVEHSDDAIFSTDLDGIIKSWNRGAQRLYGYTAEEAIGHSVTILLPEGRQDEASGILDRMRQGQTIENYETLRRRKDGGLLDISLTVSPVRDASGNVIGASKVGRDITDKVRAKEKLEQTVAERTASLREAVAQMEEFSYTVSHDLRAPLRGMQAYADALLQDFSSTLPAEANHYLNRIATNATRLDKMILDVLTFSRIGRAELRLERVKVDKLVRQIVEQYPGMQAPDAEVHIKPLHVVLGHEPSLTQAISNLLNNAVKFVAPKVRPKVCVWSEEPRAGWVRLWVADNGLGVNPKYQHRLFGMFERVHADLKYDGTGVGLAIVRRAVERMGGKVGMESDGVSGSRFWIELRAVDKK